MTKTKVLLFLICLFLIGCKDKTEKMVESIKRDLPSGTSFAEVESYLKKTKCEYSYHKETKCFTAILRDVRKTAFISQNVSIIIKMDERDKLKDLDIKVINTGL